MELVSSHETVDFFETAYSNCSIRYGDLKKQLAEDIIRFTTPLKEKIVELEKDTAYINKIAQQGAEKARVSARATLDGVQEIMGLKSIWK
jgi:tryptophanyl-tRNA synthetase